MGVFGGNLLGAFVLSIAAGCATTTTATVEVVHPAVIPVRSYPRIWVASGHLDEEVELSRALTNHLSRDGRVRVRRVDIDELEPAREDGEIPPATVVVLLELALHEDVRSEWGTRPDTVCGPAGCYTTQRSYVQDVPTLEMRVRMTVFDGPTAEVQQRVAVRAAERGRDYTVMRDRALSRLTAKLRRLVDQRVTDVTVELLEVERSQVEDALSLLVAGRWRAGRETLEAFVRESSFRALSRRDRARVLYDLGIARRFDRTTIDRGERHFAAARRALAAAQRYDPQPLYRRALRALREHERARQVVEAQRQAAEHNFQIAESAPNVPAPPPSYD